MALQETVGILTLFYRNYNFGAILQAYALYHYLSEQGYQCQEVNFQSRESALRFKRHTWATGLRHPVSFALNRMTTRRNRQAYFACDVMQTQAEAFDRFMGTEFSSTPVYGDKDIGELADCYDWNIVGGDQVWNPTQSADAYFLKHIRRGKKIAYSCSIGKDVLTKRETDWIVSRVRNLDSVSVRETSGVELLQNQGIPCAHVPDPVFLLSANEWRTFAEQVERKITKPYCFSYLLGMDSAQRKQIRSFANRHGLTLVTIPHLQFVLNKNDFGYADIDITDAGPREFVSLIANAAFVFTDSFHGTALSLLLGKPFRCFNRFSPTDTDSRMLSVLRDYSMENHLISIGAIAETKFDSVESENCPSLVEAVEQNRLAGQSYLKGAMRQGG